MRKRRPGRPQTKDVMLRLALYVGELDIRREEQCEELFRLSQLTLRPLARVPSHVTLWRWLKEADQRGFTTEEGRNIFQSLGGAQ